VRLFPARSRETFIGQAAFGQDCVTIPHILSYETNIIVGTVVEGSSIPARQKKSIKKSIKTQKMSG
jgi:hypothetical protein